MADPHNAIHDYAELRFGVEKLQNAYHDLRAKAEYEAAARKRAEEEREAVEAELRSAVDRLAKLEAVAKVAREMCEMYGPAGVLNPSYDSIARMRDALRTLGESKPDRVEWMGGEVPIPELWVAAAFDANGRQLEVSIHANQITAEAECDRIRRRRPSAVKTAVAMVETDFATPGPGSRG